MDSYALTVWLHVLAAVVWIGGMTFLVLVALPVARRPEYEDVYGRLVGAMGRRFRWIGWGCLLGLVATGFLQLHRLGFSPPAVFRGDAFQGRFGRVLAVKLSLVAAILVASAVHDFWLGPRAGSLARRQSGSHAARRARRLAAWIGRLELVAALAVTLLGVLLLHGR